MLYLLKIDALIAASVFGATGVVIVAFFVFEQTKALLEAHRFFANPVAISRRVRETPVVKPALPRRFE